MTIIENILIVDDEKAIRTVIAQVLEKRGYSAQPVSSPAEALRLCKTNSFALALLDLKMPGPMDGIGLLRELARDYPEMIVIMMTGYGTLESAIAALRTGALDYLTKPVDMPNLIEAVERGLAKRRDKVRQEKLITTLDDALQELKNGKERTGEALQSNARTSEPQSASSQGTERILKTADLMLDRHKRVVIQGSKPLRLTSTEFDLLDYLIMHSDRVVTASELVKVLRGYDIVEEDARRLMRVQIQRLRRKLHDEPNQSRYIQNVHGKGYCYIG